MKKKISSTSFLLLSLLVLSETSCKKENQKKSEVVNYAASDKAVEKSLASSLVAKYPFNGNTNDVSGYNNNVILNSGAVPVAGKSGAPNTAYYFNGSSYMKVANSSSISPHRISLVAVVKVQGFYQGTCHDNRIISKGYSDLSKGRYYLAFSDNAYYYYTGCNEVVQEDFQNFEGSYGDGQSTASNTVASSFYIKKDKWYTVIYTYDGIKSSLYINGILKSVTQKRTRFTPNDTDLFFGRNEDPNFPYYFTGTMDEIRIYSRALTPSEVQSITNVLQ